MRLLVSRKASANLASHAKIWAEELQWLRSVLKHLLPHVREVRPNPSFNRTRGGRPPWPGRRYAVHFRQPGQGVLPPRAG